MVGLVMVWGLVTVVYCGEAGGRNEETVMALEASLLKLLGLPRRPRLNSQLQPAHVPEHMLQLYRRQAGLDIDTTSIPLPGRMIRSANTARSFTQTESKVAGRSRKDRFRLHFNISSLPRNEAITGAELRLWLPRGGQKQRVLVHDIVRPGVRGRDGPLLRLLDSREVNPKREESISLDVFPAAERWWTEPRHNHGLLVEIRPNKGGEPLRIKRSPEDPPETQPNLLLFTDDGSTQATNLESLLSRRKRAPSSKKHRWKEGNCRRHPLYVDFADVGWNDWIVAPPGYDAYYCHGDCPFPLADHLNSTNHAVVQTLVHSMNPGAVPKACCVPTQLSSISMLYLDENNRVVLKNYQEMTVVGCGCR